MSDDQPVRLETTQDGIAIVLLDRPHRKNAFDEAMIAALSETFDTLAASDQVRLVFLKGAGSDFCAGADLAWMERQGRHTREDNETDALALATMLYKLWSLPQMTVALVQGGAYGGGLGLIAACDQAVAVDGARFAFSEARLGLTPATISPYVIEAVGPRNARALFASAALFDAAHALKIGLLSAVVPDLDGLARAEETYARQIGACAPGAIADARQLVRDVAGRPIDGALRTMTAKRIADRRASAEGREGLAAFLSKRKPDWAG
ncbi:MAG: enoyl-CoA hydratase-related protein [Hyphomonadaceae bacterium]|nr:enoyl-CoA hydratase-related protein [Hyphomonadaceae bacterium]